MLLAAVTATSRVRSLTSETYCSAGSSPVDMSTSAHRTVTPARAAACSQGRTLASWSSRETTISSPGCQVPAKGLGQPVGEGSHVRAENDAAGVAAHQVCDRLPEAVDDGGGPVTGRERTTGVADPGARRGGDRVDDD